MCCAEWMADIEFETPRFAGVLRGLLGGADKETTTRVLSTLTAAMPLGDATADEVYDALTTTDTLRGRTLFGDRLGDLGDELVAKIAADNELSVPSVAALAHRLIVLVD